MFVTTTKMQERTDKNWDNTRDQTQTTLTKILKTEPVVHWAKLIKYHYSICRSTHNPQKKYSGKVHVLTFIQNNSLFLKT